MDQQAGPLTRSRAVEQSSQPTGYEPNEAPKGKRAEGRMCDSQRLVGTPVVQRTLNGQFREEPPTPYEQRMPSPPEEQQTSFTDLYAHDARPTLNMKTGPLVMPPMEVKLKGAHSYHEWSVRFQTQMITLNCNCIVTGEEKRTDRPASETAWQTCFDERRKKAHLLMVNSAPWSVLEPLEEVVKTGDPARLWEALKTALAKGGGHNDNYMRSDFYSRRLGYREPVGKYIDDLMHLSAEINKNCHPSQPISDIQLADVILSNVKDEFPAMAAANTEYRKGDGPLVSLQNAISRIKNAEHILTDHDKRRGNGEGLGGQAVNRVEPGHRRSGSVRRGPRGNSRGREQDRGPGQRRSASQASSHGGKRQRDRCFRCGSECPEPAEDRGGQENDEGQGGQDRGVKGGASKKQKTDVLHVEVTQSHRERETVVAH